MEHSSNINSVFWFGNFAGKVLINCKIKSKMGFYNDMIEISRNKKYDITINSFLQVTRRYFQKVLSWQGLEIFAYKVINLFYFS